MRSWLLAAGLSSAIGWDYTQGGQDWAKNHEGLCAGGGRFSAQSPIDLPAKAKADEERKLFFRYPPLSHGIAVYNNGHSLAMTLPEVYKGGFGFVPSFSDLTGMDSAVFRLWQVSFHSPSEHTLAGRHLPLEMQMVHQRVTGGSQLAVVSVFFQESPSVHVPFLAALLSKGELPANPWDETKVSFAPPPNVGSEDPAGFQSLLSGSAYYAYEGSLTVPPCETGVSHFVRRDPVLAPATQLRAFKQTLLELCPPQGNFRIHPPFSTAGNDVVVVGSVDTLRGLTVRAADAVDDTVLDQATGTQAAAVLAGRPDLQALNADDSYTLREAKTKYQQSMMNLKAALSAKATLQRKRERAKDDVDTATGPIREIGLKWKSIEAKDSLAEATQNVLTARKETNDAATAVLRTVRMELGEKAAREAAGIAEVKMAAAPTERGTVDTPATTLIPFTVGLGSAEEQRAVQAEKGAAWASPVMPIDYPNEVALPSGLAASPFTEDMAHTKTTIGHDEGLSRQGVSGGGPFRLAPNLKQMEGLAGTGGAAPRVVGAAEAAGKTEGLQPVSLNLRLPIPIKDIINEKVWMARLREAIATDAGIPQAQVEVLKPEAAPFSMSAPVPPPLVRLHAERRAKPSRRLKLRK